MSSVPRLKPYAGPALLSYGFRPFFLLGSAWAGLEIVAWLPIYWGELPLETVFSPRDWHVHELLFGFVPAVVAGFLLTAIPNWTGRLPLQGRPLAVLVTAWIAGRFAVAVSTGLGWVATSCVDASFLLLMLAAVTREIVAGRNWRNLKIAGLLGLLAAANIGFHLEAHFTGIANYAARAGIAVTIMMIMVVGGRIIPSFTRNWLMRRPPGRLPAPFSSFDVACLGLSGISLASWVVWQDNLPTGVLLLAAGAANGVRLHRWAGERTLSDRLVLILHVGYAFVPIGFLLSGLAALDFVAPSAGIHAWTAGAIGILTLAVMSRASIGHTGRPLVASPALQAVYASAFVAALARLGSILDTSHGSPLLAVAGMAWAAAFLGFALICFPILCLPRPARSGPKTELR